MNAIEQDHTVRVLREALRRTVWHLGTKTTDDEEANLRALDDYHAARMLVGRTDGDWDDEAAGRGIESIRREALGVDEPRQDWNRCPRCKDLVDADDVHDGSEVRCHGCNLTLVCTALTDDTWTLVDADEQSPSDPVAPFRAAVSPEQRDDPMQLAEFALSEPDEEDDCLRCGSTMSRPEPELEPTPLCHLCAQATLPMLAAEVRRLREREARLAHERQCLGTAIADAAYKAGISGGLPMTGPELILMCQEMASEILRCRGLIEHSEMLLRHGTRDEMAVADVVDGLLEEEA